MPADEAIIQLVQAGRGQEAFERLSVARRKVAPVVSEHGELVGILTRGGPLRPGRTPARTDPARARTA